MKNCLGYALAQLNRLGGYLILRRSKRLGILHVMWVGGDGLRHYTPNNPPRSTAERFRAALLGFDGKVLHVEDAQPHPVKLRWIFLSAWLLAWGTTLWCGKELLRRLLRMKP